MREHKTFTEGYESDFDREVAKLVANGWEVDSRQLAVNKDGNCFVAFLSREVSSPKSEEARESTPMVTVVGGYTEDQMWLAHQEGVSCCDAKREIHTHSDEYECFEEINFENFIKGLTRVADPLDEHRKVLQKAWDDHFIEFGQDSKRTKEVMESFFKLIKIGV